MSDNNRLLFGIHELVNNTLGRNIDTLVAEFIRRNPNVPVHEITIMVDNSAPPVSMFRIERSSNIDELMSLRQRVKQLEAQLLQAPQQGSG